MSTSSRSLYIATPAGRYKSVQRFDRFAYVQAFLVAEIVVSASTSSLVLAAADDDHRAQHDHERDHAVDAADHASSACAGVAPRGCAAPSRRARVGRSRSRGSPGSTTMMAKQASLMSSALPEAVARIRGVGQLGPADAAHVQVVEAGEQQHAERDPADRAEPEDGRAQHRLGDGLCPASCSDGTITATRKMMPPTQVAAARMWR